MPDLTLSPPVFSILSTLVEERVGVSYSLSDREIFESKAVARARDAGFDSMLDYYYFLRYDDPEQREFRALVEALVVHETFLFREFEPLRVAVDSFITPALREGRRPRIWCAACATGEEPVTLAILLAERRILDRVEVIASDVSEAALTRARSGTFNARALRHKQHQPLAERYLDSRGEQLAVRRELLAAIDFRRVNLVDAQTVGALGTFDLIVCRNVLIYFREERTRAVVKQLREQLRSDGTLLVGVSESLLRFDGGLRCEEHAGVFLYRKAAE